jgi:branched-chain amino acid transport system substrate-binding protein
MRVRMVSALLVVVVVGLFVECRLAENEQSEFRIGFIAPLTGVLRDVGASSLEGAQIALDELEGRGGLNTGEMRYRVNLILEDSQNKPELAVRAAQELINHENVGVIIGPPISSLAIPLARLCSKSGILMITQASTHPDVTKDTDCVYRTCFTDTFQGEVMARFAREQLEASKAAVLFDVANAFNRGITEIFMTRFEAIGGKIVASETYTTGEQDFREQLELIAASRPDVLFLPNYVNEIRLQTDQIRELGLDFQIIGADTMHFRNAEDIARIEGAYFSTHFSAEMPDERVQTFRKAYRDKFQREATPAGALTYDALNILFQDVETQQSVDPLKLREGMKELGRYVGITGIMEFNGSPDPSKSAVIMHVENGMFHFFSRIDPWTRR